jgi:hypothetical protein
MNPYTLLATAAFFFRYKHKYQQQSSCNFCDLQQAEKCIEELGIQLADGWWRSTMSATEQLSVCGVEAQSLKPPLVKPGLCVAGLRACCQPAWNAVAQMCAKRLGPTACCLLPAQH